MTFHILTEGCSLVSVQNQVVSGKDGTRNMEMAGPGSGKITIRESGHCVAVDGREIGKRGILSTRP